MNQRDFDNLVYLLRFTPQELQEWMLTISPDDQRYTVELLQLGPHEIIDVAVSAMTTFPEAMAAIKPHMLQK